MAIDTSSGSAVAPSQGVGRSTSLKSTKDRGMNQAVNSSNFTCNEHIPNAELVATDTSSDSAAASPQGLGSSFPFDSPTM